METAILFLCLALGGLIMYAWVVHKRTENARRQSEATKMVTTLRDQGHKAHVCQACNGVARHGSNILLMFGRTFLVGSLCRRCSGTGIEVHCMKCECNLTGNISGLCPECGTEIKL